MARHLFAILFCALLCHAQQPTPRAEYSQKKSPREMLLSLEKRVLELESRIDTIEDSLYAAAQILGGSGGDFFPQGYETDANGYYDSRRSAIEPSPERDSL